MGNTLILVIVLLYFVYHCIIMITDFTLYGGAFFSFVFMLHLFTNYNGNVLLNRLLGSMFLLRVLNGAIIKLLALETYKLHIRPILLLESLMFLAPALCYQYIRVFLYDEVKMKARDLWHAIPFVLVQLVIWGYISLPPASVGSKIPTETEFKVFLIAINSFIFLIYMVFSYRMLLGVLKEKEHELNSKSIIWMYLVISIPSFSQLLKFIFSLLILTGLEKIDFFFNSKFLLLISSVTTTFFILFILKNPQILYGNLTPRLKVYSGNIAVIKPEEEVSNEKIEDSNATDLLETEQVQAYLQLIENYMNEELPYLDPGFNISQLSEKLDIPVHHCSFVLNQGLGKNFREYINKFRVDFFIKEYPKRIENQTLESIASGAGFNSSSTFYKSFKKETGKSPTNYFS